MTTNPISHQLDSVTRSQIKALYAAGQSLKAIVKETGVRYSLVYFYTVNGGKMDSQIHGPHGRLVGCFRCQTHPFGQTGLCRRCYQRQWQRKRKKTR